MHLTFPSGTLTLEGELTPTPGATRGAVICHPHPQYGGDMDNPVVRAVESGLQRAGYATLRFNFRGTGRSTGTYDNGIGEADDARAAVACLIERSGIAAVTLAGYSFGAMVTVQAAPHIGAVERLIAVAPPLAFMTLDALRDCTKPKLFLVGDGDQYCGVHSLTQQLATLAEPHAHDILPGADHFFFGYEEAIADAVHGFVAG